jgi:transposase InsO family protein
MEDSKSEKAALFRFGLIATLVLETLTRGELMRRARELASLRYDIPFSERTSVSVDTLLKWARRYRKGGLEALSPQRRKDRGQSRVISPQLAELIERLKRENPHRAGTTLLKELALSSDDPGSPPLSAASLYRFLKKNGLTPKQLLAPAAHKKFEAEFANQIWQSDMMFGPYIPRPGGGKQQAMLYAILDDASRLIPHAQFYGDEGLESLLDCIRQGVAARGIPVRLYVDNGKVYRSVQLARIAASLGILIVHTPPYQPEGRGKIERFFRSVREQFLASLDLKHVAGMEDLNARLDAWIQTAYHRSPHGGLPGNVPTLLSLRADSPPDRSAHRGLPEKNATPLERWQRDIERVRQLPPATDVRRLFFFRLDRLVRRDSTFLLRKRFYEAPAGLAGNKIEVRFDPMDPSQADVFFEGALRGAARLVDPVANGLWIPAKPGPGSGSAPPSTGINYVELLYNRREDSYV